MLTGEHGKLMMGYATVAVLGNWSLTCQQLTLGAQVNTFEAKVVSINRYLAAQRPLHVGLWMGINWWVWMDIEVDSDPIEGELTMRVKGNPVTKTSM